MRSLTLASLASVEALGQMFRPSVANIPMMRAKPTIFGTSTFRPLISGGGFHFRVM